ncbi:MAG: hypothetical protein IJ081_00365 [Prevotella sp.]|nr:hypothetical protein [Prevotella sp.]
MARVKGILEDLYGRLDDNFTICHRGKTTFTRPAHIRQPHRLSRKQLLIRERQSHNNALWRALKESGHVYFEADKPAYNHFMAINMHSPVPYIPKHQYRSGNALLLPQMVISDGPLPSVSYQLDEVNGQPALLTDLTKKEVQKTTLLLFVLRQKVITCQNSADQFYLSIQVEPLSTSNFTTIPSTANQSKSGILALVGPRFADPMLGFGIVRVKNGHASPQRVVTHCTYYEQYTTEEALQIAAKSYGGLTGADRDASL